MYSFVFHYNSFTVSDNEQTVFFSGNVGISQKQDSVQKNWSAKTVDMRCSATVCRPERCCFLHTSPTNNISSIPPRIHSTAAGFGSIPKQSEAHT